MPRLLNVFGWKRRRLERELDRELRYHVDRRVEDLVRAGASQADARRRAEMELGGVARVREEVREAWVWRWLDNAGRDVRYAVRTLWRTPSVTVTAMVSLALGIGANTAIFSLIDQVMLRPLPVSHPERLVHMAWRGTSLATGSWGMGNLMSYPVCRELDAQHQFLEGAFCRHPASVNVAAGRQHVPVRAEIVSGSYFPVLGVRPERGRLLDRTDDLQPGAHPVVVLSYDYWRNTLGGADDVVGRTLLVNNHPMTVIGVTPARFRGIDPLVVPSLWIPAMMKRQATPEWDRLLDRRAAWMHVLARVRPEVTADEAKAGLQPWFASMLEAETQLEGFPSVAADQRQKFLASTLDVLPAAQGLSAGRGALERPLLVLMGGTVLLVLLSSLNVAGLLVARGAARSRELTTRMALGASRRRIAHQLLTECALIALAGGLLAVATAPAAAHALRSLLPGEPDLATVLDLRVFVFAFLVSATTGGLCGVAPALHAGRLSTVASSGDRSGSAPRAAIRFRKGIVVAQLAFTLVLLIGAGLFVQTLARLYSRDLGFVGSRLLMFYVEPDSIGYSESDAAHLLRNLLRRLAELPVVESAALANNPVLSGGSPRRILTIEADRRVVTDRLVPMMRVTPGFFTTVGVPVLAGRDFNDDDTRDIEKNGYRAIIVNERFARRYFGDRSPIGHRVGVGNQPDTRTTIEIVGVVKDFSFRSVRDDYEPEHVFFPFAQTGPLAGNGTMYVKVRGEPKSAFQSIRAAVGEVDDRLPLLLLTTVEDQIERALRSERMLATLSSAFGAIALLLSVVGLYGVMSFIVARRTKELGLRLALGATRAAAVWLILRDALVMVIAGTAIALPAAGASRRLIQAELFGVSSFDGSTIVLASALLAVVALGAAMLPAWRAASVSPTEALRFD